MFITPSLNSFTVKEMKNKWRHIRDSFSKSIQPGKTGDSANKKKKYVYSEALSFLLQTMEKRSTSGNITNEVDEDSVEDSQSQSEKDDDLGNVEPNEGPAANNIQKRGTLPETVASFKRPNKNQRKLVGITSFQSQLLEKLDISKTDEQDADKSFLLSLLPDYKKLNDEEKLDFRLHTLQFFRDIRRRQNAPSTVPQPNPSQPGPLIQYTNYLPSQFSNHSNYHSNNIFLPRHNPPFTPHLPCSSTSSPSSLPSPHQSSYSEDETFLDI